MVKLPGRRHDDDEQPNRKDAPRDIPGRSPDRDRPTRPLALGPGGSSDDDDDYNYITGRPRQGRDLGTGYSTLGRSADQKPEAESGGGGWLRRGRGEDTRSEDTGRGLGDRPAQATGRFGQPPEDKRSSKTAKSSGEGSKRGGFLGLGRSKDDDKDDKKAPGSSPFTRSGSLDDRARGLSQPDRSGFGSRDRATSYGDADRYGSGIGTSTRDRSGYGDAPGTGTRDRSGSYGDALSGTGRDRSGFGDALGTGTRDRSGSYGDALGTGTRDRSGSYGDALGTGTRDRYGGFGTTPGDRSTRDADQDSPRSAAPRSPYGTSTSARSIVAPDRDKDQDKGEKKRPSLFGRGKDKDKDKKDDKDKGQRPSRKGETSTGTSPFRSTSAPTSPFDRSGASATGTSPRDRAGSASSSYDRAGSAIGPRTTVTAREPAGRADATSARGGLTTADRGAGARTAARPEPAPRAQGRPLPGQKERGAFTLHQGLDLDHKIDLVGLLLVAAAVIGLISVLPSMTMGLMPEPTAGLTYEINRVLSQIAGWGKIALPLAAGAVGIWMMKRSFRDTGFELNYIRLVGMAILFGCALAWLQMIELFDNVQPTVEAFRPESYALAVEQGRGGGWIGHQVYIFLLSQFLDIGTIALLVAAAVAGIMLAFDVTVVEIWAFVAALLGFRYLRRGDRAAQREARRMLKAEQATIQRPNQLQPALPLEEAAAAGLAADVAVRRGRGRAESPVATVSPAEVTAERSNPRINRRTGVPNGDTGDGAELAPDSAESSFSGLNRTVAGTPQGEIARTRTGDPARATADRSTVGEHAVGAAAAAAAERAFGSARRTETLSPVSADDESASGPERRRMPHMPRPSSAPAVMGADAQGATRAPGAGEEPARRSAAPFARPVTDNATGAPPPAIPVPARREQGANPASASQAQDDSAAPARRGGIFGGLRRGASSESAAPQERISGRKAPGPESGETSAARDVTKSDDAAPARRGLFGGLRRGASSEGVVSAERPSAPTTPEVAPAAGAAAASGATAPETSKPDEAAPARRGLFGGLRRGASSEGAVSAERPSAPTTPEVASAAVAAAASGATAPETSKADEAAPARRGLFGGLRRGASSEGVVSAERPSAPTTPEVASAAVAAAASGATAPETSKSDEAAPARRGLFGGLRRGASSEGVVSAERPSAPTTPEVASAAVAAAASGATAPETSKPDEAAPARRGLFGGLRRGASSEGASAEDVTPAQTPVNTEATARADAPSVAAAVTTAESVPSPPASETARPVAAFPGEDRPRRVPRFANPLDALLEPEAEAPPAERRSTPPGASDADERAEESRRRSSAGDVLGTLGAIGAAAAAGAAAGAVLGNLTGAEERRHPLGADADRSTAQPVERRPSAPSAPVAPVGDAAPAPDAQPVSRPDSESPAGPTARDAGSRLEELRRMRERNPNIPATPPPVAGTEDLPPRRMPQVPGMSAAERTARELGLPRPSADPARVTSETAPASPAPAAGAAGPTRVTSTLRPVEDAAPTMRISSAAPSTAPAPGTSTPRTPAAPSSSAAAIAGGALAGAAARRPAPGLGATRPAPSLDDDLLEDEDTFDDDLDGDELDPDEIVDTAPARPDRPPLTVRRRSLEGRGPSAISAPAEPAAAVAAGANAPQTRIHRPGKVQWTVPDFRKLLRQGEEQRVNDEVLLEKARVIEDTLMSFDAPGKVVEVNPGPVITQFGVEPDYLIGRGGRKVRVKVGQIARLDADLALALAARTIRIEAPVPGKGFVGIEVPNDEVSLVSLYDIMESPEFNRIDSKLRIALGLAVDGTPVAADLTAMPHLLIAGTTGSGKSVCVNSIIASLLLQNTPDDLQFIMVDPKRVELTAYNGIPHLVAPVVVELERIVGVLQWVQREMEERYRKFAAIAARNILDYNRKVGHDTRMPYYVVVVDELADLMMLAPDETERLLARLAQMARATGIHLIISTQRPSVDIITGLIKANFPARIAFAVASSVDSRVILDQPGAEKLLGRGDMLFQSPDAAAPLRLQGVYVSDEEIAQITRWWKGLMLDKADAAGQRATLASPSSEIKLDRLTSPPAAQSASAPRRTAGPAAQRDLWDETDADLGIDDDEGPDRDGLYEEAVELVQRLNKASISLLQRRLRIGYTRAARLIDMMEAEGIVGGAQEGSKPREVLKRKASTGDD